MNDSTHRVRGIVKTNELESKRWSPGCRGENGESFDRCRVSVLQNERALERMVTQHCECTDVTEPYT